eukprot:9291136-Alexandrium_andersonii.AAC.1
MFLEGSQSLSAILIGLTASVGLRAADRPTNDDRTSRGPSNGWPFDAAHSFFVFNDWQSPRSTAPLRI